MYEIEGNETRTRIVFNEIERLDQDEENADDDDTKNETESERDSPVGIKRKLFETEIPQSLLLSHNGSQNDSRCEDSPKDTPKSKNESRFATARAHKGPGGEFEIGLDTLNIIEYIEALSSAGNYLLSKNSYTFSELYETKFS